MKYKILAFLSSLFLLLMLCGCGIYTTYHNKKADDAISQAVYEALGENVYFIYKEKSEHGIDYIFLLMNEDIDCIKRFTSVINQLCTGNDKTNIFLHVELPGGTTSFISFYNYSDRTLEKADYDGFYYLDIQIPHVSQEQLKVFENPSIYSELSGIRKLCIDQKLQEKAEEMGIDWYEVWPDLEKLEIED